MPSEQEVIHRDDAPPRAARGGGSKSKTAGRHEGAIVGRSVTIDRPRGDIYDFWRNFSNLAGVMENVARIDVLDERRSHWMVKAPGGRTVEWDSVIVDDEPDRLIAWQSVEGSDIQHAGRVEFVDAAPGRGTIVRAIISYDPPGGTIGEWIAKIFQREPNLQTRRDLRRLKQFLETGEVTSSAGPSGRSESPTEQTL